MVFTASPRDDQLQMQAKPACYGPQHLACAAKSWESGNFAIGGVLSKEDIGCVMLSLGSQSLDLARHTCEV